MPDTVPFVSSEGLVPFRLLPFCLLPFCLLPFLLLPFCLLLPFHLLKRKCDQNNVKQLKPALQVYKVKGLPHDLWQRHHVIKPAMPWRRLILHSVLATNMRRVPMEDKIKCTKHNWPRREATKSCQMCVKYSQGQNLPNTAKRSTILQLFCLRHMYVLEVGLTSQLKPVCFLASL